MKRQPFMERESVYEAAAFHGAGACSGSASLSWSGSPFMTWKPVHEAQVFHGAGALFRERKPFREQKLAGGQGAQLASPVRNAGRASRSRP
jgi:hypothetical protein